MVLSEYIWTMVFARQARFVPWRTSLNKAILVVGGGGGKTTHPATHSPPPVRIIYSTQHACMFAGCELPVYLIIAYLHIHVSGGEIMGYKWATSWSVRRVQTYDTDKRSNTVLHCYFVLPIYLALIDYMLTCPASNQSDHRIASRSPGPFIFS